MQQPETPLDKPRIFFANLDGWRFVSFFAVFLYHCQISFFGFLKDNEPTTYTVFNFLFRNGYLGVNFFFVLSGFLITFLLIKEKELKNDIHVGKFYMRRILRIWPLYYLCLVIGFIIFPMLKSMAGEVSNESANPFYYIFFAANFDYMHTWPVKPEAILLSVLWSVTVEEQFYLTWPLVLKMAAKKMMVFVFPAIIVFSLIFRSFYTDASEADHAVRYFHTFSLIGDMALGGLLAYGCSFPGRFRDFVTNMGKPMIAAIYIATIVLCLFKQVIFPCGFLVIFERIVIAFFFGMIIVEQNYARNSFFKMGKMKLMSKLGIYTYGFYCLHLIGMYIAVKIAALLHVNMASILGAIGSAVIALAFSLIISIASYHFYEKWFLRLKERFAFIVRK